MLGRTRTSESHASRLRRKLNTDEDRYVVNVWGVVRGVAGIVGRWRQVALRLGFRAPLRLALRSRFTTFGHGLGTSGVGHVPTLDKLRHDPRDVSKFGRFLVQVAPQPLHRRTLVLRRLLLRIEVDELSARPRTGRAACRGPLPPPPKGSRSSAHAAELRTGGPPRSRTYVRTYRGKSIDNPLLRTRWCGPCARTRYRPSVS